MTRPAQPRTTLLRALRGWPLFIVLSLLLHLLLLLLFRQPASVQRVENAITPLAVRLEAAPRKPAPPAPPVAPKPVAAAASKPVAPPASTNTAPAPAKPAVTTPAPVPTPNPWLQPDEFDDFEATGQRVLDEFPDAGGPVHKPREEEVSPDEESRLQIESLIRTRFAGHFVYPPLAQRHNWQGEVVLAFRVETDGTINAIEVERSSGYAILDQAARDSLHAIERLEFTPGLRLRQMLELRMPVVYQLAQL